MTTTTRQAQSLSRAQSDLLATFRAHEVTDPGAWLEVTEIRPGAQPAAAVLEALTRRGLVSRRDQGKRYRSTVQYRISQRGSREARALERK